MDRQHGTWGERVRTFETDSCLVTILYLKPNKRCSWHRHNMAFNQFFVISGQLGVKTDIGPNEQTQVAVIEEGQGFVVKPGVMHEFITYDKETIIEEVAYVKYDESDILRQRLGGDCE